MVAPVLSIDTQHDDMIHDAQLDYYGKKLATCSSDRTVKIYNVSGDVQTEEQVLTGHEGPIWQVAWAHPKFGVLLATCSYDGKVLIYRESQPGLWNQIHVHSFHACSVNSISWAPYEYGLCLACASADGKVSILSHTAEGWIINHFQDSTLGCNAVSWAPYNALGSQSGKRVVTASCDKTIKIWQHDDTTMVWSHVLMSVSPGSQSGSGCPVSHQDWVRDVAWAPSTGMPCNTIASGSEDQSVFIWTQTERTGTWSRKILTFDAPVWRVSWSMTGNVLAVSSGDHQVSLWKESLTKEWIQVSHLDDTTGGLTTTSTDNSLN